MPNPGLLPTAIVLTCWTAGALAQGAKAPEKYRAAAVAGMFACDIPEAWSLRDEASGPDRQLTFEGVFLRVRVTRYGLNGSAYATPQDLERSLRRGRRPFKSAGPRTIAGRNSRVLRRQYEMTFQGDEDPLAESMWYYQETAAVPAAHGFWALEFQSKAPHRQEAPEGLDIWRRFLDSFKPEPPAKP